MSVAYALLAAFSWGAGGLFAGLASRRIAIVSVLLFDLSTGVLLGVPFALITANDFFLNDFLIGCTAGLFGAGGALFFYRALRSSMTSAAPIAGVMSVLIPLIWSMIFGESISVLQSFGILFGLLGIFLVSNPKNSYFKKQTSQLFNGIFAGIGFGTYYLFLDATDSNSAPWPAVGSRILPAVLILIFVLVVRPKLNKPGLGFFLASATGIANLTAAIFFLAAVNRGPLGLTSVLASLFPAITVTLARFFLNEKMSIQQTTGVIAALLSIVLIVGG